MKKPTQGTQKGRKESNLENFTPLIPDAPKYRPFLQSLGPFLQSLGPFLQSFELFLQFDDISDLFSSPSNLCSGSILFWTFSPVLRTFAPVLRTFSPVRHLLESSCITTFRLSQYQYFDPADDFHQTSYLLGYFLIIFLLLIQVRV